MASPSFVAPIGFVKSAWLAILFACLLPHCLVGQGVGAVELDEITMDIEFTGGSIAEFVNLIRGQDAFKQGFKSRAPNIVVTEAARDFQLPEIKISSNFKGVTNLLGMLGGRGAHISIEEIEEDDTLIYLIDVSYDDEPEVHVINTRQLLGRLPEEDVLSAIEIGFQMQGRTQKKGIELKLHKETGLMFVRGTTNETSLVDNIVGELYASLGIQRVSGPGSVPGPGGYIGSGPGGYMGGPGAPGGMGMGMGMGMEGEGGSPGGGYGGKFSGMGGMGMGAAGPGESGMGAGPGRSGAKSSGRRGRTGAGGSATGAGGPPGFGDGVGGSSRGEGVGSGFGAGSKKKGSGK